jgi:hypothetical protein
MRVLLIAPRLGETAAVFLETPLILAASWFVCRWCAKIGANRHWISVESGR